MALLRDGGAGDGWNACGRPSLYTHRLASIAICVRKTLPHRRLKEAIVRDAMQLLVPKHMLRGLPRVVDLPRYLFE